MRVFRIPALIALGGVLLAGGSGCSLTAQRTATVTTPKTNTGNIKVGSLAPDFDLRNQEQIKISLSEFKGKKNVVLVFYPADFTPVWVGELSLYRDDYTRIQSLNTEVLGISVDNWPTHAEFSKQLKLPFDLLSDWSREVSKRYGAWDATELTATRRSFLIDKSGKVVFMQEADLTKPRDHAAMMKAIEALSKKGG